VKALCYHGARDLRFETIPDATLADERDILVRMQRCGICGSDLHIYHGKGFSHDTGFSVGHEAVGEVIEVGRAVRRHKPGDRVMISAAVGCGECPACLVGHVSLCAAAGIKCYGLGHALQGCQAQAIRVPAGDFNAARIPEGVSDDQALMLTDNLPTAWLGCRNAEVGPGKTVVVIGLGAIGLMAVEASFLLGAARVLAVDLVAGRRAAAEGLGAVALEPAEAPGAVKEATAGAMADCVIEAVGDDATIALALRLAAREGVVSVVGVSQSSAFAFPMQTAFLRGLTFRIGTSSVRDTWPTLVPLVREGRLRPQRFVTHEMPLSNGAEAYRLFDSREPGVLKVVLTV